MARSEPSDGPPGWALVVAAVCAVVVLGGAFVACASLTIVGGGTALTLQRVADQRRAEEQARMQALAEMMRAEEEQQRLLEQERQRVELELERAAQPPASP